MAGTSYAAAQVRSMRLDRGMSPEQLAESVGVSGKTIRRIEDARRPYVPNPSTQYAIARHFGLRPTEIWRPGVRARRPAVQQQRAVAV